MYNVVYFGRDEQRLAVHVAATVARADGKAVNRAAQMGGHVEFVWEHRELHPVGHRLPQRRSPGHRVPAATGFVREVQRAQPAVQLLPADVPVAVGVQLLECSSDVRPSRVHHAVAIWNQVLQYKEKDNISLD